MSLVNDPAPTPAEPPDAAATPEAGAQPAGTQAEQVASALEALLFAADAPLSLDEMRQVLPEEDRPAAGEALQCLLARYGDEERALQILAVAGGFRMTTRPGFDRYIRALYRNRQRLRLGRAALETLAIVAYRQPITAPEIAEIRGKDPAAVLKTLLERRLVRTRGRKRVVGKPFLYGTTREFLEHFGLNSLEDLPSLEEFQAMLGDSQLVLPEEEGERGADVIEEGEMSEAGSMDGEE